MDSRSVTGQWLPQCRSACRSGRFLVCRTYIFNRQQYIKAVYYRFVAASDSTDARFVYAGCQRIYGIHITQANTRDRYVIYQLNFHRNAAQSDKLYNKCYFGGATKQYKVRKIYEF